MTDTLTERLEACYTGVVHDIMRGMGLRDFTLPQSIRPIIADKVLAGPVFTVTGHIDKGADAHETLLAWTGLLSKAKAGHVWVSQPNDRTIAHMGELSAETLQLKGMRGCVTSGAIRDVDFLLKMDFQTWCDGFTPRDIVGMWLPDAVDVPITIDPVTINPGDYCLGDRDGMVIIPKDITEEVITKAEDAVATENKVRTAILAGDDPQQAYLKFGKF